MFRCYEPKLLFMLHWSIKQPTRQYFKTILFTRWPSSCSECNLTPFWQLFSGSWGSLGPHLEPAGRLLGAIWSVLGTFGMCLGASIWSLLHPTRSLFQGFSIVQQIASRTLSNRHLVVCWSSWKPLGAPRAPLGRFWERLEASWGPLCSSLGYLGGVLRHLGSLVGRWRGPAGPSGCYVSLGASWGALRHSWRTRTSW